MNHKTKKILRGFSIILLSVSIVLYAGTMLTGYQGGLEIFNMEEDGHHEDGYIFSICSFFLLNIIAVINYADMRYYAKKQYKKSEKANLLIKNYQQIIETKDLEIKEKIEDLSILLNKKMIENENLSKASEAKKKEYEQKIKELEESIKAINLQKEELADRLTQINVSPDYDSQRLNLLRHTDSYLKLNKIAQLGGKSDKRLLVELESEVDYLYPNFTQTLFECYPMITEKQLNLCLLMKAGFQTKDIASLLCMHHTSISHLKSRIFQSIKIAEKNQEVSNLSEFINQL